MLRALLDQPDNAAFLRGLGYRRLHDLEAALCQLSRRFQDPACFPHELGLFLGYPLEDVQGFIQNDGKNYLFKGFRKVYAKEEASRERFAPYMKCGRSSTMLLPGKICSRLTGRPEEQEQNEWRYHIMAKTAVVCWSGTGNTQMMAEPSQRPPALLFSPRMSSRAP